MKNKLWHFLKHLFGKEHSMNSSKQNKYAFMCGVNIFQSGNNLRGCVNDVMDVRERLVHKYAFKPDNIRVLTDTRATTKAQLEHIDWLISCCDAVEHDLLVWDNSSHGTRFRIRHGDNLDNYEQDVICPHDFDWDKNFISADMIHERFDRIPPNTTMIFISDSCASGNLVKVLTDSKSKSIIPPEDILARSIGRDIELKRVEDYVSKIDSVNILFLSGCQSQETSADAYIKGRYNGALTAALKAVMDVDNSDMTWKEAHQIILHFLEQNDFEQHPQLKGSNALLNETLFT